MSSCCTPTQVLFNNADITTIQYTDAMRSQYGIQPRVFVYYYDAVTGEFVLSVLPFTQMKFDGNNITIDHGGPASGYVVIT